MMYFALALINIIALSLLAFFIVNNKSLVKHVRFYFTMAVCLTIIAILAEAGTLYFTENTLLHRLFNTLSNVIGFILTPMIPIVLARAIVSKSKSLRLLFLIPSFVNAIVVILSPFFGLIFAIDDSNSYQRGNFFFIFILAYAINIFFFLFATIKNVERYQGKLSIGPLFLFGFILIGTAVQVIVPELLVSFSCISLSLGMYYAYYCDLGQKYDPLTELLNRRMYDGHVLSLEDKGTASVIIFDVNSFKAINDTYGHLYGDDCLQTIAFCIRRAFGDIGLCYRIGGDEFCVIAKPVSIDVLEKATLSFSQMLACFGDEVNVFPTVSVGFGDCTKEKTIYDALRTADKDMYQKKINLKIKLEEQNK